MKKLVILLCAISTFGVATVQAKSMLRIIPNGQSSIPLAFQETSYLSYTLQNGTTMTLSNIAIDPTYDLAGQPLLARLGANNACSGVSLAPGASCSFVISLQALNQAMTARLNPRVCAEYGSVCSVALAENRIKVQVTSKLPTNEFPVPYAGAFYPVYNDGWVSPTDDPAPPFNEVSAIFIAFAHAYPQGNGAILDYEHGQMNQSERLTALVQAARAENPEIKLLISLGWGKNDWTYINNDYVNHANIFVPSVVAFVRNNHLDGFDIDDESINVPLDPNDPSVHSSGFIPLTNFDGVVANLRNALNEASLQDGKPYYLTITPAGNNLEGGLVATQVDSQNAPVFNLINIQSYFAGGDFGEEFFDALLAIAYPKKQIANGIDVEMAPSCDPEYPDYTGLAGLFNWTLSFDKQCSSPDTMHYANTLEIANLVGYDGS